MDETNDFFKKITFYFSKKMATLRPMITAFFSDNKGKLLLTHITWP